jgi:hypothetical protein
MPVRTRWQWAMGRNKAVPGPWKTGLPGQASGACPE